MKSISWILRIIAAVILLQTLYFKFTAQPESVNLFSLLGMEPWGRIATGVLELIAAIFILIPKTKLIGAGLGLGLMSGALFFHFTKIGIVDATGNATLFIYATVVFIVCGIILALGFKELKNIFRIGK